MVFEKKRHRRKYIFDINELFIQCNKDSCCEHITDDVNIYLYGCVSLLAPECAVCLCVYVFVCVCVISNQITSKNPHYVSDLSKLDTLMHKTHIKYQGSTCVDP